MHCCQRDDQPVAWHGNHPEPSGTRGRGGTATLYRWRACKKLDQIAYVKAYVILCAWVTNWESQQYLQTRSNSIKRNLRGWVWKSSPISGASQFPKVCWACSKLHLLSCSAQKKPTGHRCTCYWDLLGQWNPQWNPQWKPQTPVEAYKKGTWTARGSHRETWPAMTSGQSISTKCRL